MEAGDSLRHHCGVVGISSQEEINLPEQLFYGLFSLQHRGQESAGLAYHRQGKIISYRDVGMVSRALSHYQTENHPSRVGIGHVRYSTHGTDKLENAQPIVVSCSKGEIALAHNGNISNSDALQKTLIAEGSIFQSTTDTELLLHMIARSPKATFHDALVECLGVIEGAYCFLMMHEDTMIAVRDPWGFRPLVMGTRPGQVLLASETCALEFFQAKDIREIAPGEIVTVEGTRVRTERISPRDPPHRAHCIFELIYFARPDSEVFARSVHMVRKRMGELLARDDDVKADIVIPIPDSGNSAALGYAAASGLPLEHGLTRNHYMGRTFIQPTTAMREFGVRMKLNPVREAIGGKRVIVVDDSLVRGTTSRQIVRLLRDGGAREVHLRLSSPPIRHPCFFGIDIPTPQELIANRLDPDGIAREIGADSVRFLPIESLRECVAAPGDFCYACFSGSYPFPVRDPAIRRKH
ncbi:MAG TPA: amidophosphoribosyltransferase [Spirochaetia bacterium]|nr:amidophosphoribosyltransferase [Spirochaetia bacterium]